MSKQKKQSKLVPELRFPEFEESGEWEKEILGDVATFSKGKGISKSDVVIDGKQPCIRYGELYTHYKEVIDCVVSKTNLSPENLVLSKENDVIIPSSGETQEDIATSSCVLKSGVALGGDLNIIRSNINGVFLSYYLNNAKKREIARLAQGISVVHLYSSQLAKLEIEIPKPQEQQKIAQTLTSLDDLIAAETEKLDALQAHKKGLLQQLFPAEGERVPKVRFGEFRGAWEEKELGDLIDIKGRIGYRGYTREDIVSKGEGAISMSPSNIDDNGCLNFEKSTYITWDKYEESPEIMLEDGYTVLVKTGSSFGKAALVINLKEKTTINPQLVVLKPKKIDDRFLFLIVTNTTVQRLINETVVGGAIPTLSQKSISKFQVLIPKPKEQQKIANCLSSLDDLIAAQSEKIEVLKTHKKGLLQQLFPNIK